MKTLKDFFTKGGISSIEELVEKELSGIKEPFKTQKKQVICKLNDIFNGYFLDGFQNKLYGNFLSRALTAYVISNKFGLDYHEATKCITDDKLDYGIDAIYIENETIYIFQTKFSKSVDTNDLRSLKDGIAKLLNISNTISDFNTHIQAHKQKLCETLIKDAAHIVPVFILFGDEISQEVQSFFSREITHKYDFEDFVSDCIYVTKKEIFEYEITPYTINENFVLDNFFCVKKPIKMYSGCIKASFLKELFSRHGNNLFYKNIRFAIRKSPVNIGIQNTVTNTPDRLLYYHNGITFICDKISEKAISATSNSIKHLSVNGLSVVNGAQTISSLSNTETIDENALVQIRIIETDDAQLSTSITQYNNHQNAVSIKDLRTLDPIHTKIKRYFLENGYYYTYKTGENSNNNDNVIDFEDLMIALACFYDLARTAKFNKGLLWESDTHYRKLLKIEDLPLFLKISQIKKIVDTSVVTISEAKPEIVHYNRLILSFVLMMHATNHSPIDKEAIYTHVNDIFTSIEKYVAQEDQNLSTYHRKQKAYETLTAFCLGFNEQEKPIQQNLF